MKYLRVKNWSAHQHYKDRNPSWIKVYVDLLTDYAFSKLSDIAKGQLVCIWLLASKTNGLIPNDPKWIASKINATEKLRLNEIMDASLLIADAEQSDSDLLPDGYQSDSPNTGTRSVSVSVSSSVSEGVQGDFDAEAAFDAVWADVLSVRVPNPAHKGKARRLFRGSVKSEVSLTRFTEALSRYRRAKRVVQGWVQDAGTWFGDWEQWETYTEPAKAAGEPIYTGASAEDADAAIWPWLRERVTSWLAVRSAPSTSEEDAAFMHHTNGYSWAYCCEQRDKFTKEKS